MILTKEFMQQFDGCAEGYRYGLEHNLIPGDYDAAIAYCRANGADDYANWLEEQKATEAYVRQNGEVFMMGAYQVFNPITGLHTRHDTEEEARAMLRQVAQDILAHYAPRVTQELANEHGDTTWIPTTLHETLVVT